MMHHRQILILPLFFLACSGVQTRLPVDGPQTAEDVLARALARPLPKSAQGMTRLEAYVKKERRSVDMIVQLQMPNAAQMQAVSPTLDMLAVMATDGKRFVSFERGGQRCFTGEACPLNMARLLPIALSPEQLVPALLGRPPLLKSAQQVLQWDSERNAYVVLLGEVTGTHQQVYVSPQDFRFLGTVMYEKDERVASMEYVGAGKIPETLRYKAKDVDVTVSLRKVDLDLPVDVEVFAPACPDGMLQQELPCVPPAPDVQGKQKSP